jgi:hypothetical protein
MTQSHCRLIPQLVRERDPLRKFGRSMRSEFVIPLRTKYPRRATLTINDRARVPASELKFGPQSPVDYDVDS